jgi:hypothetical protein
MNVGEERLTDGTVWWTVEGESECLPTAQEFGDPEGLASGTGLRRRKGVEEGANVQGPSWARGHGVLATCSSARPDQESAPSKPSSLQVFKPTSENRRTVGIPLMGRTSCLQHTRQD